MTTAAPASSATVSADPQPTLPTIGRRWIEGLLGSDPALNQLRSAALGTVTLGLVLAAEALFVRVTHAMQIPVGASRLGPEAARAATVDHENLVVFMLLGAMVGFVSSIGVNDPKAKGQLITLLLIPAPLVAFFALSLALGGDRLLSLILLPVVIVSGTYLRRFGPRGQLTGLLMFFGFFLGLVLHGAIAVHDLGWLTAAIGVGLAVTIAVRILLFFPNQARALHRTQLSFGARAQKVARLVVDVFDAPADDPRPARHLEDALLRLNEAALMIDAQLGDPAAVQDGSSRQQLHQRLFDVESALANVARFVVPLARIHLPGEQRSEVRLALLDIVERNFEGAKYHAGRLGELLGDENPIAVSAEPDTTRSVLLHRFAGSTVALADGIRDWLSIPTVESVGETFEPSVALFGGWLPGSTAVSSIASVESGDRPVDRARLKPWTRTAIQLGVAVAVATALGDLISPSRYYWAIIAVYVVFMGANTSGEQTRKALFRVWGTVVGIVVGLLLVDAVGHNTDWTLAVVLVSMFFGFYLMRVNSIFFVIAIIVSISQLYQELHRFSNTLLLYRLYETTLGAAVAILVVTFVLPLRTRRVLRVALRSHVQAIEALVDHASEALTTEGPPRDRDGLRNDARAVDASYQALVTTAEPLRHDVLGGGDEETRRVIRLASVSRNYSRDLVTDLASAAPIDPAFHEQVDEASIRLHRSMDIVAGATTGSTDGIYVRSSSLYDRAERSLEGDGVGLNQGCPAIRDLQLIDGSMATLAEFLGLEVDDFDTREVV